MDLQVTTGSPKSKGPDWAFELLQWRGNLWHCGPAFACKSSRCHEQQWDQTLKSSGFEASKEKISCKKKMEILYTTYRTYNMYIYRFLSLCYKKFTLPICLNKQKPPPLRVHSSQQKSPPPRSQWSRLFERTRSSHLCSSNWVPVGVQKSDFFRAKNHNIS